LAGATAAPSWLRWTRAPTALVLLLLVAALALALPFYRNWNLTNSSSPEKSIAVLPFENVGEVKDALADGIQDDILTKLASIDDLKVISRTSVMSYRGQRNLPEIARGLHVTYVLEGSVRRTGEMVHLNTQLIDARTDNHIWAQEYDRDVRDIFKIQSDIAQSVAQKLHAYLDSADRQTLQRAASDNVAAFDLYSRAKNLLLYALGSNSGKQDLMEAAELTNQALAQDARFFQAYCLLGSIHGQLYILGHDHTAARLAMAEEAIARAFQLRPGAAEAHLARAEVLYRGHLDTDAALAELAIARKELPNEPRVAELEGYIKRRLGRYGEALRDLNRAAELDPRNVSLLLQIALSYTYLRRYSDAATVSDRALAIEPSSIGRVARAQLEFAAKADTRPWHEEIESVRATNPAELRHIADQWLGCALAEHDVAAAKQALIAAGENTPLNAEAIHFPRPFAEGLIARMEGDEIRAHAAFVEASAQQEKVVAAQPDYAPPLCVLGVIDAYLGRKEVALREGRRAVELLPVEKDAINGPLLIEFLGVITAWVGEKELACEQLARAARYPGDLNYGDMKLMPYFDPLRGLPCFEQTVNSLAPKF
jgi:TolB-like protein/Flp pilus assembly protein TadD